MVIEHLEPGISPWIMSEYRYVSKIFGKDRVTFTNVKDHSIRRLLEPLGTVDDRDFIEYLGFELEDVIVLDPQAEETLRSSELRSCRAVVIGGIMGDHPPKGRTKKFISNRALKYGAKIRNLGRDQLTIAGTAYIVKVMESGRELSEIEIVKGLRYKYRIHRDIELEIYLPYAFPAENGKPVLPDDYLEVIARQVIVFEQKLLSGHS